MPVLKCPCGARLKAPDNAAGKRVKCPKCQTALRIPAVPGSASPPATPDAASPRASARPTTPRAASPGTSARTPTPGMAPPRAEQAKTVAPALPPVPAATGAADPFSLDGEFLAGMEGGVAAPALPALASAKCPKCGASMAPGTVLCTACGFNSQTGKKVKGAAASSGGPGATSEAARAATMAAVAMGATLRGVIVSCVLAAGGAGLWAFILFSADREIGIIAWIVGALAGAGMAAGSRTETMQNGLLAAAIALAAIVAAKTVYVAVEIVPGAPVSAIVPAVLQSMVNPWDALFAGLALFTAYRLGSNGFEWGGDD